jgi:hypothetical protein
MSVGAAKAEGVDAHKTKITRSGKCLVRHRHAQLQRGEVDVRIRCFKMQSGRNTRVLEHQRGFDQTSDARGRF